MKGFWLRGMVFIFPLLLLSGTAFSFTQFFSPSEEEPDSGTGKSNPPAVSIPSVPSSIRLGATNNGIRIRIRNAALVDVLQQVANETDIRFRVAPELTDTRVNADIEAPDWDTGLRTLLKDLSRVELWDHDARLSEVTLLKSSKWTPPPPAAKPDQPKELPVSIQSQVRPIPGQNEPGIPVPPTESGNTLSNTQLRQLAKGPYRSPLPAHLFEDPAYREYLARYGIETMEDMQVIDKAKAVRRAARKQLLALRKTAAKNKLRKNPG